MHASAGCPCAAGVLSGVLVGLRPRHSHAECIAAGFQPSTAAALLKLLQLQCMHMRHVLEGKRLCVEMRCWASVCYTAQHCKQRWDVLQICQDVQLNGRRQIKCCSNTWFLNQINYALSLFACIWTCLQVGKGMSRRKKEADTSRMYKPQHAQAHCQRTHCNSKGKHSSHHNLSAIAGCIGNNFKAPVGPCMAEAAHITRQTHSKLVTNCINNNSKAVGLSSACAFL